MKRVGFAVGVIGFVLVALLLPSKLGHRPAYALAVLVLMMAWWFTEAIPIYATALVPLLAYPLFRVEKWHQAALPYADGFIFLFLGGMVIAAAMQQCGLHRRIALHIMRAIGTDPKRLLLGFMVATAFISLWISNTATATMMLPIGMAVIAQLEADAKKRIAHYGCAIMLAIAYACNIGGIGTVIGTAPNAQFAGFVAKNFKVEMGFLQFFLIGFPFVVLFLPVAWLAVWQVGKKDELTTSSAVIHEQLRAMGPMSRTEKIVLAIFATTALLWVLSQPITRVLKPGIPKEWKFGSKEFEWIVAMLAALALVASRKANWAHLKKVPWETLLLLGGSFSLAFGIEDSGLSRWAGEQVGWISTMRPLEQVLLASFVAVFVSAFASNTATIGLLLPLIAGLLGRDAFPALAAATIATSCDFMLPAGTPPNAIVFGSGYVSIPRMMKTGFVLDLAAALVAALWAHVAVRQMFG